jgi:hypothetical protein
VLISLLFHLHYWIKEDKGTGIHAVQAVVGGKNKGGREGEREEGREGTYLHLGHEHLEPILALHLLDCLQGIDRHEEDAPGGSSGRSSSSLDEDGQVLKEERGRKGGREGSVNVSASETKMMSDEAAVGRRAEITAVPLEKKHVLDKKRDTEIKQSKKCTPIPPSLPASFLPYLSLIKRVQQRNHTGIRRRVSETRGGSLDEGGEEALVEPGDATVGVERFEGHAHGGAL